MDARLWQVLLVLTFLVLLVPTCGTHLQDQEDSKASHVAKKAIEKLTQNAVDKFQVMKRSLTSLLSHKLSHINPASRISSVKKIMTKDSADIRVRTRREVRNFLDSLSPYQLVRLRRAVRASKMIKVADGKQVVLPAQPAVNVKSW